MDGSPASPPAWRNSRRPLHLRHAGRPALAGIVAAIGLVSVPVVAQAQPPVAPPPTGAAACNLVSQADVSYVVGRTVPAPQVVSSTQVFDKRYNISGTLTECTYGSLTGLSITKVVVLTYEALSAPVPAALEKADLQAAQKDSGDLEFDALQGLGPPRLAFQEHLGRRAICADRDKGPTIPRGCLRVLKPVQSQARRVGRPRGEVLLPAHALRQVHRECAAATPRGSALTERCDLDGT